MAARSRTSGGGTTKFSAANIREKTQGSSKQEDAMTENSEYKDMNVPQKINGISYHQRGIRNSSYAQTQYNGKDLSHIRQGLAT